MHGRFCVLFHAEQKKKQGIFHVRFDLICMFMIPDWTERTEKLPYSFLRQNRKEKEFLSSFHFTTYVSLLL